MLFSTSLVRIHIWTGSVLDQRKTGNFCNSFIISITNNSSFKINVSIFRTSYNFIFCNRQVNNFENKNKEIEWIMSFLVF